EPQREPRLVRKQGGPERRGDDSEPRLPWPGWGELLGKLWRVGHRCAHITARTACRCAPVGELNIVHTLAWDVHRGCPFFGRLRPVTYSRMRGAASAQFRRDELVPALRRSVHGRHRGPDTLRSVPGTRASGAAFAATRGGDRRSPASARAGRRPVLAFLAGRRRPQPRRGAEAAAPVRA